MSPQEVEAHIKSPAELVEAVGRDATAAAKTIVNHGLGRVVDEDGDFALFQVYEWEWVQQYRKTLDLPQKDCHVTLAFSGVSDIHGYPKGISSCSW